MHATIELLEQFKQAAGVKADSPAAQAPGVKYRTVSNWRNRESHAEPKLIERMCIRIGADPVLWLLRVQMEQSPDTENKQVWHRISKKLGYTLAVALTVPCFFAMRLADEGIEGLVNDSPGVWNLLPHLGWTFGE